MDETTPSPTRQALRVLLLCDEGTWTAQCLEHDVAAQGKTIDRAVSELQRTLVAEVCLCTSQGARGLERIARAPRYYWRKYHEAGERVEKRRRPVFTPEHELPPGHRLPELRELRVA